MVDVTRKRVLTLSPNTTNAKRHCDLLPCFPPAQDGAPMELLVRSALPQRTLPPFCRAVGCDVGAAAAAAAGGS